MRFGMRLLSALTLTAGVQGVGSAQAPRLDELLARKPVQPVTVSTPAAGELPLCRVEPGNYPKPATGTVVRDGQGKLLRQFIDSDGRGGTNLAYFYQDGVEAYREIDGNRNGKPDQFRWLGVNGGKWGADANEDGVVDLWYVLSPQELSQEVFAALQSRDPKRIEALTLKKDEAATLGLPAADADALVARSVAAVARAKTTADTLALTPKAKWIHVEIGVPYAVAADTFGGQQDLVKQPSALVLYDNGEGKADVFTVGEMVQVGKGWRLIDGPVPGANVAPPAGTAGNVTVIPPEAQPLLTKLQAVKPAADRADMRRYHLDRAAILEQIVTLTKADAQQPWLKQVVDSYAAAAEAVPAESGPPLARLKEWADMIAKDARGTAAASYAAFRTIGAESTVRTATAKDGQIAEAQKGMRGQLEEFVAKNPTAAETPEGMMRLAISHEFTGRDGEAAAKGWYEKLAAAFPADPNAAAAEGAVRRLTSEGRPFALPPAPTLDGTPFNFAATLGKPTLVVYYLNWGDGSAAEGRVVSELKNYTDLVKSLGDKLNVVTVSLDDDPRRAVATVNAAGLSAAHLHLPGGLQRSPLAVAYGIQTVPHVFLLDKTGKVVNRNAQYGPALRDEIDKLLK